MRIRSMKLIPLLRPTRLLLVALLALPCPLCTAAEKSSGEAAKPATVDSYNITIDFPGGPLSKLMSSLNVDKEPKLSIIQSAGLDPILPAFSVRDARVDSVIAALGRLMEQQGYYLSPVAPNLAVLMQFNKAHAQDFASFQLENKLGSRSVDEIVAAIQMGCEFANPDSKPSTLRFKYHPATKLLFVAGTEQEVGVAQRVFGSLPNSPEKSPPPTPEKR